MEPSKKDPAMDNFVIRMTGVDRKAVIQSDMCVPPPIGCGQPAKEFRDEISRREYSISGLCQNCQDEIFGRER